MVREEEYRYLAENTPDILCRVSLGLVLTYVSPSSVNVLGWKPEEMVGGSPEDIVFKEDLDHLHEHAARTRQRSGPETPAIVRIRKKDGTYIWMEVNTRLAHDEETGQPTEIILVMRDISARKLLEDQLSVMAMTDGLTGLANRRAFDEGLEREWKRTSRAGTQMSLLLLDIDHFKKFNDEHGHQVGDDCLRAVANAAARAVGEKDIVARYGGEEIAIILPLADTMRAVETAEKVRAAIEGLRLTHTKNPEGGGWVTASIGAATALARHGGTMRMPESLLLAADNALYKAKHGGRNRVESGMLIASQYEQMV
jgi:diguanylate cyclase (GGDEF)-like protein/PAS domain S-box-containing protein